MTRARRLFGTATLLLLGVAGAGLALEASVLLLLGEQPRFPRRVVGAPFGVRINEPRARYRHVSADVDVAFRINARGMRADRDYAYEKPPGTSRIVSLGDSFTIGYEVDVRNTFSSVLEEELRARGVSVEVLNAGVSGHGTAEELLYLRRELFRYQPDLVLVSFFGNDLVDNVRSGLFRLEGDRLLEAAPSYVPAGRLGDFLNTLGPLNALGERSNAFAFLKERLTLLAKGRMVEANLAAIGGSRGGSGADAEAALGARRLAGALLEEIYRETRARGIPLLIQSIPMRAGPPDEEVLVDGFPHAEFDVERPGVAFFAAKSVLDPDVGKGRLYHARSHGHWTPHSHRRSGEGLAKLVVERGLLGSEPPDRSLAVHSAAPPPPGATPPAERGSAELVPGVAGGLEGGRGPAERLGRDADGEGARGNVVDHE
jgi:hypothetical protein